MRHLLPNTVLDFGKNRGMTVAEVFHYQPSYIEYLIMKHADIAVDLDALEALPPPVTISYNPLHFSVDKPKLDFNEDNLFDILAASDTVNAILTAEGVKKSLEAGFSSESLNGFEFPEFVKARNREKQLNR